jgi:hypothetical protein
MKYIGLLLAITGFLAFIYFKEYRGKIIPLPFLWGIVSLVAGAAGMGMALYPGIKKKLAAESIVSTEWIHLKESGEQIVPDLDHCEFKTNHYIREPGMSHASAHAMNIDPSHPQQDLVNQTVIIYYHVRQGVTEIFSSHVFPVDQQTLGFYVASGRVILYVNRFNRSQYYFQVTS